MHVYHLYGRCLWRPKMTTETGCRGACQLPCGCWEWTWVMSSVLHHWAVISTLLVLLNGSCVVCNHASLLLNVMLYQGPSVCKVPRSKPSMSDLSYHGHRRGMPNFFLASHAIPQHTFVIKNRGHTEVHQEIILILSCCATAKSHRFWESGF